MLIVLNQLLETRFGLSTADRREFAEVYGDPWFLVKTLLGHADVETTRRHYLSPVTHLHLESILACGVQDPEHNVHAGRTVALDEIFARLAAATAAIQDVELPAVRR